MKIINKIIWKNIYIVTIIFVAWLNFIDGILTAVAITYYNISELNPIMNLLYSNLGVITVTLLKIGLTIFILKIVDNYQAEKELKEFYENPVRHLIIAFIGVTIYLWIIMGNSFYLGSVI